MAYALILLAVLGIFLFAPPAHTIIAEYGRTGLLSAQSMIASGSVPFTSKMHSAYDSVRSKAMELFRKQLHNSIDGLVK